MEFNFSLKYCCKKSVYLLSRPNEKNDGSIDEEIELIEDDISKKAFESLNKYLSDLVKNRKCQRTTISLEIEQDVLTHLGPNKLCYLYSLVEFTNLISAYTPEFTDT